MFPPPGGLDQHRLSLTILFKTSSGFMFRKVELSPELLSVVCRLSTFHPVDCVDSCCSIKDETASVGTVNESVVTLSIHRL